jgi:hypothetical protein
MANMVIRLKISSLHISTKVESKNKVFKNLIIRVLTLVGNKA